MANFNLEEYATVNERIQEFYTRYPDGVVQTDLILNENGTVIFKAYIYKNQEDNKPTIGHAMEKEGSSFINKTSHIENAETSAVGRALAMMGFCIKKSIASREEVENAKLNQDKPKTKSAEKWKTITVQDQKSLFILAKNDAKLVKEVLLKYGWTQTKEITLEKYPEIIKEIESRVAV